MFNKKFVLYYQDKPVMEIIYSKKINNIIKIGKIFNKALIPIFLKDCINDISKTRARLCCWIDAIRCIPKNRENIQPILKELHIKAPIDLAELSMGFSMTDCYWYGKDAKSGHLWNKINYFDNPYGTQIGELMINGKRIEGNPNWNDPALTVNGQQNKAWFKINSEDYLLKVDAHMSNAMRYPQSANEIIGQAIAKAFKLKCAEYHLIKTEKGDSACISKNFATKTTEFIPLWLYVQGNEDQDFLSIYKNAAKELNIPETEFNKYINKLALLITTELNSDFNYGNIGFIIHRYGEKWNAEMGIIFDNGMSSGIQYIHQNITQKPIKDIIQEINYEKIWNECPIVNPMFGNSFKEIATHIKSYDDVDIEQLKSIPQIALEALVSTGASHSLTDKIVDILSESTQSVINKIEKYQKHETMFPLDNKTSIIEKEVQNVIVNEEKQNSWIDR